MKRIAILLVLALLLGLFAGCRSAEPANADPAPSQSDTAAPDPQPDSDDTPTDSLETDEPEIDTTPEPIEPENQERALDRDELASFWALFSDCGNWYNQALTSEYARPEYIDLYQLFYNGIDGVDNTLTDAEREYLSTQWSENAFDMDIIRLPAEEMNKILRQYFGVSLSDTYGYGLEEMTYFADEDCYFLAHGDTNAMQALLHSGVEREDGTVVLYYSANGLDEAAQAAPDFMVEFQPTKDGYLIRSNGRANP